MPQRKYHLGAGDLILNSPFAEPSRYWSYDRKYRIFTEMHGRRPAGYVVASPDAQGFDDPGQFIELPLVNQLRPLVQAWREAHWPGVTGITRRLLEHWYDPNQREARRLFFCQLEAIETLIWLTESPAAQRQGVVVPGDGGAFARWCAKMATGTGKTIVMGMLIAWEVLNKVTYAHDERFSKHVLVIAPGLTVRNCLQVLIPDSPGNYYDEFHIVPVGLYHKLRQGRVLIHNWHKLAWDTEEQVAKRRSVDKRGPKSDEAYVREVLGEMAAARNLVVVNDEAHHAWRVPAESKVRGLAKAEIEEATKWVGGLDRIHGARGILQCFDFSATPYAPSGKKSDEEALFGWIVSDFGLNDAIESGLVKTPRVVIRDNGRLTAEFKSRFYHLYRDPDVTDDVNRKAEPHEPLPDIVTMAYDLLGTDWLDTARDWKNAGHPVPPVMITVANRTETAARIKYALDHEKIHIEELCRPERTLHIDSKVLEQAEARDQAVALAVGEEDDEDAPAKHLTKQEQAELLRRMVDTVGQSGRPGEQIQKVISVGMLSEGWDAKTVTHVMGLRAFTSQLLCEQVVGRGLRPARRGRLRAAADAQAADAGRTAAGPGNGIRDLLAERAACGTRVPAGIDARSGSRARAGVERVRHADPRGTGGHPGGQAGRDAAFRDRLAGTGPELVDAWVKNDHLGFEILYVYRGVVKKYRPDFLSRLRNGTLLVLEVKGEPTDEARAKQRFLEEWVSAVNADGGFGRWAWAVSRETADLAGILDKHSG